MPAIVYILLSGITFIVGAALITLAVVGRYLSRRRILKLVAVIVALIGAGGMLASGTPVSPALYWITWTLFVAWLALPQFKRGPRAGDRRRAIVGLSAALVAGVAAQVAVEFSNTFTPELPDQRWS